MVFFVWQDMVDVESTKQLNLVDFDGQGSINICRFKHTFFLYVVFRNVKLSDLTVY